MVLSFRVAVSIVSGRTRCRCRAAPFKHGHSKTAALRQEENGKNFSRAAAEAKGPSWGMETHLR